MISCSETNKLENVNKILLFGDSLMSGYGLKENQTLSIILENDLKEAGYNIKIINGSVSGDTSEDGIDRIDEYTSDSDIDLIILGLGANDMLRRINPNQTESTTDSAGSHTHSLSGSSGSASPSTNSQGSSATNANLPPYYALCYIMKA